MIIQFYSDEQVIRGFVGNQMIFESIEVDWRKLDALGLPRLGKHNGSPWKARSYGWEISVEMKCALTKRAPDARKPAPKKVSSNKKGSVKPARG